MKDGFVIYKSFYSPISKLSDEQLGRLFRALFEWQIDGDATVTSDIEMAFDFFVNQFVVDNTKYQKRCEKNRANIGKRWSNNGDTKVYNGIQSYTNDKDKDKDKDKEKDKDKGKDKEKGKRKKVTYVTKERIERLYSLYPSSVVRSDGNRVALKSTRDKAKLARLLERHPEETIAGIINRYVAENRGPYIKMFSTFLNNLPDYTDVNPIAEEPAAETMTLWDRRELNKKRPQQ